MDICVSHILYISLSISHILYIYVYHFHIRFSHTQYLLHALSHHLSFLLLRYFSLCSTHSLPACTSLCNSPPISSLLPRPPSGPWVCGARSWVPCAPSPVCSPLPCPSLSSCPTSTTSTTGRPTRRRCKARTSTTSPAAHTFPALWVSSTVY